MTPPLELIVAMMPSAARITAARIRQAKDHFPIGPLSEETATLALYLAEKAILLSSEPEQPENRVEIREEIRNLLKSRLCDSRGREGLLKALGLQSDRGWVGITGDGMLRVPDSEADGLTLVPVEDVLAVIEEADSTE